MISKIFSVLGSQLNWVGWCPDADLLKQVALATWITVLLKVVHFIFIVFYKVSLVKFWVRGNILQRLVTPMNFISRQKRLLIEFLSLQLWCLLVLALEIFLILGDMVLFVGHLVLDGRLSVRDDFFPWLSCQWVRLLVWGDVRRFYCQNFLQRSTRFA